jgi:putative glycosyltransferase (TIGR04372 family)
MDIFLMSRCKFFLCSETGLNMVASSFRKPLVLVNYVLFDCPLFWTESVFITKKFFFRSENRFLSFREILTSDFTKDLFDYYGDGGIYNKVGIDLIENTPQEIESATIELNKRMDGTWVETEEDKELQRAYWDLYSTDSKVHATPNRRRINVNDRNTNFFVGAEFLRNNKFLLER